MSTYRQGVVSQGKLHPDPQNVRSDLGDLTNLADSIRANGILQPLLVRPQGDHFVIVDGHRRHAAGVKVGVQDFPCLLLARSEDKVTATMLAASLHKQLEPIEQARAFKALRDRGMGTTDIAKSTGYSAGTVRDRLVLLDLPTEAQQMVTERTLPIGEAVSLGKQVRAKRAGTARRGTPRGAGHFISSHPLANAVRALCTHHDTDRPLHGNIGCGQCWEAAIRADATGQEVERTAVDRAAIERAMQGERNGADLTIAELDEVVTRLTAQGRSAEQIATSLGITSRTVTRARRRQRDLIEEPA